MKKKTMQNVKYKYTTEDILVSAFPSARTLKNEIRSKIRNRRKCNWHWCGMISHGAFISLCFKKSVTPMAKDWRRGYFNCA